MSPPVGDARTHLPVRMLLPRRCKEAVLSKCQTSGLERLVSLLKSGPEKCKTSFTDFSLAFLIAAIILGFRSSRSKSILSVGCPPG